MDYLSHMPRKNLLGPMNLLDRIGSLFVYRSPNHFDGYKSHLRNLSNRQLRSLVGTTSHYSKDRLIEMYLQKHLQASQLEQAPQDQ